MSVTATIKRTERIGLHELVRNHLASIGDVWLALESEKDAEKAKRLAQEFAGDFRLLDDIGWDPEWDPMANREIKAFELTMPPEELTELLGRLFNEAWQLMEGSPSERRARYEDAETDTRFGWGLHACNEVLIDLQKRERDEKDGR
jgi:hypothetical protein